MLVKPFKTSFPSLSKKQLLNLTVSDISNIKRNTDLSSFIRRNVSKIKEWSVRNEVFNRFGYTDAALLDPSEEIRTEAYDVFGYPENMIADNEDLLHVSSCWHIPHVSKDYPIASALVQGIEVEKEHKGLYNTFKKYLDSKNVSMPMGETTFYARIALDHIKESSEYYTYLHEMEKAFEQE